MLQSYSRDLYLPLICLLEGLHWVSLKKKKMNIKKKWADSLPVKRSCQGRRWGLRGNQQRNNEVNLWSGALATPHQVASRPLTASLTDCPLLCSDSCLPRTQAELLPCFSMPWRATCSPRYPATACPSWTMHGPVPTEKLWCQRLWFGCPVSTRTDETPWPSEVKRSLSLIGTLIIKTTDKKTLSWSLVNLTLYLQLVTEYI